MDRLEQAPEVEQITPNAQFGCFMVPSDFHARVGTFDENFAPVYYEDVDMRARLAIAGIPAYTVGTARMFHFGSSTILHDEKQRFVNGFTFAKNRRYFASKWGQAALKRPDDILGNYFATPFNQPGNALSYWRVQTK